MSRRRRRRPAGHARGVTDPIAAAGARRRKRLRRISTASLAASVTVILLLTLTPVAEGAVSTAGLSRTAGHVALFAVLGVAVAARYASSDAARRAPVRVLAMAVLAVWIFAALDELAQERVGRSAQLSDWFADMLGAMLGITAGSFALRRILRGGRGP